MQIDTPLVRRICIDKKNTDNGMKCEICLKHEIVGTFVTGCKNYNKNSIL